MYHFIKNSYVSFIAIYYKLGQIIEQNSIEISPPPPRYVNLKLKDLNSCVYVLHCLASTQNIFPRR
jgi:hypothetical protein